jgi:hypothetical protein
VPHQGGVSESPDLNWCIAYLPPRKTLATVLYTLEEGDEKWDGSAIVDRREITGRHITLEEVMRPAVSVRQDTRAGDALKVMLDNGVPGIPTVNDRGYLVGFIHDAHLLASTLPNFVRFVDNLPHSSEDADGRVHYNRSTMD